MGEKHYQLTATPTIRLLVAVDLGWASHDVIEEMIAERPYIMYDEGLPCNSFTWRVEQVLYGRYTFDIYNHNVGLCIFAQYCALGGEARAKEYGRPF